MLLLGKAKHEYKLKLSKQMTKLYGARDRSGQLRIFTSDQIVKNNGRGYWIPKYNSGTREFVLNKDDFPEISWEDAEPTYLELVNPLKSTEQNEEVSLPGTIRVGTVSKASPYNIATSAVATLFVCDISWIEPSGNEKYPSLIHMKSGEIIQCEQEQNEIKKRIRENS